jgi:tetratricopeptide (TPR) repeat protein
MSSSQQLNDTVHQQILQLSKVGDACIDHDDYPGAITNFRAAFELIPQPFEEWEASTWLLASLGEAYFFNGEYEQAHAALAKAMHVPGAIGNSLIHLRLGQVQYELGNTKRAADELLRAYMAEGEEIFDGEDDKYFDFLKKAVVL